MEAGGMEDADLRVLRARSWVTRLMLGISTAAALGGVLSLLIRLDLYRDVQAGLGISQREAVAADTTVAGVAFAQLGLLVITGVAWAMWQHRAHLMLDRRLARYRLSFTPGWAVGWWFIPVANLFQPFRAMNELWKASDGPPGDPAWSAAPTPPLLIAWWGTFVGQNLLSWVASFMAIELASVEEAITIENLLIAADLILAVSGILAFGLVGRITGRLETSVQAAPFRSEEGAPPLPPPPPPAPHLPPAPGEPP